MGHAIEDLKFSAKRCQLIGFLSLDQFPPETSVPEPIVSNVDRISARVDELIMVDSNRVSISYKIRSIANIPIEVHNIIATYE